MNDSFLVRGFQRFGDLLRDGERFFDWNRPFALDSLRQRLAGHHFHDQITRAAGLFQSVNRGDVRMIQRRQHFRFALKTGEPFGIVRKRFRQNFDGHVAPELGVMRLIHFSHSARANLRDDFVGAEFCARGNRHTVPANQEWREYTTARPQFWPRKNQRRQCQVLRSPYVGGSYEMRGDSMRKNRIKAGAQSSFESPNQGSSATLYYPFR